MNEFYERAIALDKSDTLKAFKEKFVNDDGLIYLDGNSLGKLPLKAIPLLENIVREQWGNRLIRSWNEQWIGLPERLSAKIATIVGARADEIFVGDATTLNLYKLAFAALKAQEGRTKIISDEFNFPADLYVIQGLIRQQFFGHQLEILKSRDGMRMDYRDLFSAMDRNTALLTLSHVAFKSAFMYDMAKVNSDADSKGIWVIWDLSHAAGAVPLELNKNKAHMAVGCTYKYLNGGPGSPAFLYVSRELQDKLSNPVWSWFSHSRAFDFDLAYEPHSGIQKFACGTPQVLSMAAIEPGLDILIEAGMENLRKKSVGLIGFLAEMVKAYLEPLGFSLASPLDEKERGSHISLQHPDAYRINRAMIEPLEGGWVIIPDFRPPNNIRLGVTPLYTSYSDLFFAVKRMLEIVEKGEFKRFGEEKLKVT